MAEITLAPSLKQHLCYQLLDDRSTHFVLFGGGAGGGKSWLGCEWLLRNCYLYPGSKWFIGRKELKRLMSSTYITWLKVCQHHKIPQSSWRLNGQYNYIEFVDGVAKGSRIDLLDLNDMPSDPLFERFGSLEYTGGWIEEAGEVSFMAFDVLKTRIGRHLNSEYDLLPKMLLTCNPTQNWLFRIFYKPNRDGTLSHEYAFIRALHNDNPYQPETYADQLNTLSDPILRARLKEGKWEYSLDELAIINYEAILDMFDLPIPPSRDNYLVADVARYGSDKSVIGVWRGLELYSVQEFEKQSLTNTEEGIKLKAYEERVPFKSILVDEDGVGGGIVDHLAGVQGFMGNRAPIMRVEDAQGAPYANIPSSYLTKPNFKNLRTQCHFLLASKINNHEISITAPLTDRQKEMIVEELRQVKRVDTGADEALQIVAKDEVKEAIGRSPDYSDMLMMRMFFEVAKEVKKPVYNPPKGEILRARGIISDFGGVGWN
jgi:hypothetical protein